MRNCNSGSVLCPNGTLGSQPQVARRCQYDAAALPGETMAYHRDYPEGVAALIPNIPFIPLDPVFAEERAQFVLERELRVMLFLIHDVLLHAREV